MRTHMRSTRAKAVRAAAAESGGDQFLQLVEQFIDKNWNVNRLSAHPLITQRLLRKMPKLIQNGNEMSQNPNLTWKFILAHPKLPWNFQCLSNHSCITWDIVLAHPSFHWNWKRLSSNPNITWDIIQAYSEYPWDPYYFSQNPNLTWEVAQILMGEDADCTGWVLQHPNITWDNFINGFLHYEYYASVSLNPNINPIIIEQNSNVRWCSDLLAQNPSIPFDFFLEHEDMKWNWRFISAHPNVFWTTVVAHPEKHWNLYDLCKNPNLPWKVVLANHVRFGHECWWELSSNPFLHQQQLILAEHARRHLAAYRLQKWWRSVVSNPSHSLCQRVQWLNFTNL